jgi:hypothetical protein
MSADYRGFTVVERADDSFRDFDYAGSDFVAATALTFHSVSYDRSCMF